MRDVALRTNDQVVDALRAATLRGGMDLRQVPGLLKRVLRDGCWRERIVEQTGETVRFTRFPEFVTAAPLEGMGCDLDMLKRICAEDKEALDMLDRVTQQPRGGDRRSEDFKMDNVNLESSVPDGNSAGAALRRLRKEAQAKPHVRALYERVLKGELSPHAAAIEAGFRAPTVTVPREVGGAARALLRHFSANQIDQLVALLVATRDKDGVP